MRVTAEVKQQTEQAIRATARNLFARRGVAETSTREIAAACGIAVGTLFNYFPSKEALALTLAADAFASGRTEARHRLETRLMGLEESLFTLIAADIRALHPIRRFVPEVLETGLSPFAHTASPDAAAIRASRVQDAAALLTTHGLGDAATPPVMHLYWSLYLGVLSYWAADASPNQEDTWAVLDHGVRMFVGSLRPPASGASERAQEVVP